MCLRAISGATHRKTTSFFDRTRGLGVTRATPPAGLVASAPFLQEPDPPGGLRETDCQREPATGRTFDHDLAAVCADDSPDDEKAEAVSVLFRGEVGLEDPADIFRGNAGKAGLLAAEVTQDDLELLWKLIEQHPGLEITVNLRDRTISASTAVLPFTIDDYTAWRLLEGLDDIGLTLRKQAEISAFESARPSWKPRIPTTS